MKKLILGLVIFLFTPLMVSASDIEVKVTNFFVDAYILENGDMQVNELIVAKGNYNWYERDLLFKNNDLDISNNYENNAIYNASDISNILIKAKSVSNVSFDTIKETDFEQFSFVNSAVNGDRAKYTVKSIDGGKRYRTYYRTYDNTTAFLIQYTVKDVVVLHNDVAELYWTFVPDGFEEDLHNIKIKVHLPEEDKSNNFRFWAHGNLSGDIENINQNEVYATISDVFSGESVDVRITFDKSLVNENLVFKKSNNVALDKIIEVETERANIANQLREEIRAKYYFVVYGSIGFYLITIILFVFIYFKYGKSPKSGYYSKYNREFIDDYNVEVIDYLMNKRITPNAMSASIMNLVYKKNLSVEEIAKEKSSKKDYKFTLENENDINNSEKMLIQFLFDRVGKGNIENDKKFFTTMDLKKYADGTKTCNQFISSYTKWKNDILAKGKKEAFYESFGTPKIIGIVLLIISFMLFMFTISNEVDFIPAYFVIVLGIVFFMYTLLVDRKTKKGAEHYDKWKAFKNFLNDFGTFELKELPEIVLWERYLVYATIFGLADKVQKSMNVRINELDLSAANYDYYPSFVYINIGHSINNSINQALNSAYSRQAANYANSHSSSSSGGGFGGGFSSGGGFGGGGGGGRFG